MRGTIKGKSHLVNPTNPFGINFCINMSLSSGLSSEVKYTLIVIYSIICIFGTFSNTVSMLCLFKQWKNKPRISNSQKILMSLIVSDLLVSCASCPIRIVSFLVKLPTRGYIFSTLCSASSLTIFLLAWDKYLKLTRFGVYEDIMTQKRLTISIGACWMLPMMAMTSAWWFTPLHGIINGLITCFIFVSLPILYLLIFRFYKESKHNLAKFPKTAPNAQPPSMNAVVKVEKDESASPSIDIVMSRRAVAHNQKNQRRLTMKILSLMSTYFVCKIIYAPIAYLMSFRVISHSALFYFAFAVYLVNSMLNPIIYVFRDAQFRHTVKQMFGMQKRKSSVTITRSPVIANYAAANSKTAFQQTKNKTELFKEKVLQRKENLYKYRDI